MRFVPTLAVLAAIFAGCAGTQRPKPTTGAIAGLARDHDSGDPVAKVEIRIRTSGQMTPISTLSRDNGLYDVDHLKPGRYTLSAQFAGQPVEVANIDVRAGEVTMVDLTFTLGRPEPIRIDYNEPKSAAIDRYKPKHLAPTVAMIEGTVNDSGTRQRVVGAVVTVVSETEHTEQTVSDEQGRYRFDAVRPGTYSVSAYYSVGGRGQIEVRRSGIEVAAAEAVVVPLWIEMAR